MNSIRHFFIPTQQNDYHAHSLQVNMLSVYLFVAVMLVFVNKQTGVFTNVLGIATDISASKLLEYTNSERLKAGIAPVSINAQLSDAAQKKASNMFQNNYWAHFGPHGESPWDFIKQSGYQYEFAGENLAKNFLFSQNVVDAWMKSPTHRENLLRSDYREVGFAVVNGVLNGEETTLVVQMFGAPIHTVAAQPNTEIPLQEVPQMVPPEQTAPKAVQNPTILGQNEIVANKKATTRMFAYNINLIFVVFIALALILDLVFAAKLNILHIRSKHIAHLIFVGFIGLGLLFVLRQGAIL